VPDLDRDGYTVLPAAVPADAVHAALRVIGLGIRRHGIPGGAEHADCQGGTFLPELRDDPAIWALLPHVTRTDPDRRFRPADGWAEPQILLRFPDEAPDWHAIEPCRDCGHLRSSHYDVGRRGCMIRACTCARTPDARPALVPHVDEEPEWAGHEYVSHPYGAMRCAARGSGEPLAAACNLPASDPIHVRRRYRAIVGVALTDHGPDDGALHVWPGSHDENTALDEFHSWAPVPVPLNAGDAVVMHPKLAHAGSLNLGHKMRGMAYFRLLGIGTPTSQRSAAPGLNV
jgi:hypothetical protein